MYLFIFLLSVTQLIPTSFLSESKEQDVRLGGKVFITYLMPSGKGITTVRIGKRYYSDFKVLLIPKTAITNTSAIIKSKSRFCTNDAYLFRQYNVKVAYSNADGYFEFRGLRQNTHYILIFCDRDIQVSESATGASNATFNIGEKLVKL